MEKTQVYMAHDKLSAEILIIAAAVLNMHENNIDTCCPISGFISHMYQHGAPGFTGTAYIEAAQACVYDKKRPATGVSDDAIRMSDMLLPLQVWLNTTTYPVILFIRRTAHSPFEVTIPHWGRELYTATDTNCVEFAQEVAGIVGDRYPIYALKLHELCERYDPSIIQETHA